MFLKVGREGLLWMVERVTVVIEGVGLLGWKAQQLAVQDLWGLVMDDESISK